MAKLNTLYIYIYIILFELPLGQDPPNHPVLQVPDQLASIDPQAPGMM
jgi:hypothetical protein